MAIDPRVIASAERRDASAIGDLKRRVAALEAVRTQIGADSIVGANIAPNSITTNEIAANTITAADIQASAITTNEIAANTITAGDIAANTITAGQIAASTITTNEIAAFTINAGDIAANTITSGQIAAGTITATQIASGTISTGNLAAGSVTASILAANAVTANAILAGSIDASKIATDTLTATQIAAGAITASELAANSVTASAIVAGAVDATKISVSSLSSLTSNMGSITAGTITGGTIQTASSGARTVMDTAGLRGYALDGVTKVFEINSGSGVASFTGVANIQTGSTIVPTAIPAIGGGGGNLIKNSSFEYSILLDAAHQFDNWVLAGAPSNWTTDNDPRYGTRSARVINAVAADAYIYQDVTLGAGDYILSGWIKTSTVAGAGLGAGITAATVSGTANFGSYTFLRTTTAWTRTTLTITVTSGTAVVRVYAQLGGSGTCTGTAWFDGIQLEGGLVPTSYTPMASEIAPGTITQQQLAPQTLGESLVANSSFEQYDATTSIPYAYTVGEGSGTWVASTDDKTDGARSLKLGDGVSTSIGISGRVIPVNPGDTYIFRVKVRHSNGNGQWYLRVQERTTPPAGTDYITNGNRNSLTDLVAAQANTAIQGTVGTWFLKEFVYTVPAGTYFISPCFLNWGGSTGYLYVDEVEFRKQVGAKNIEANAITANEIAANTITAAKIAANTITASQIASGTITATQIAAGAITTNLLAAGAVTAQKLTLNWGGTNMLPNSAFSYWTGSLTDPYMNQLDSPGFWQHYDNGGPINGIRNPSLETNATDWQSFASSGSATFTRVTTDGYFGTACAEVAVTGLSANGNVQMWTEGTGAGLSVSAGDLVFMSVAVKSQAQAAAGGQIRIVARYQTATGTFVANSEASVSSRLVTSPVTGRWYVLSGWFTVPATAGIIQVAPQIVYDVPATTGAYTLRVDAALAVKGMGAGVGVHYFDGATNGGAWLGAAHASQSTNFRSINLLQNPSFEGDAAGWTQDGDAGAVTAVTASTAFGSKVAQTTLATSNNGYASILTNTGVYWQAVTPGVLYTSSIWIKPPAPASIVVLYIQWLDAASNVLATSQSANLTPTANTWAQFQFSAACPAGAVGVRLFYRVFGGVATNVIQFDGAQFSPVFNNGPVAFFDGSTAGATWTGTANASASIVADTIWSKVANGAPEGRNAWRAVNYVPAWAARGFQTQTPVKLDPNTSYVLSFQWKGDRAPRIADNGNSTLTWINPATGADLGTGATSPTAPSTTAWTTYAARITYNASGGALSFNPGGGVTTGWDYIYLWASASSQSTDVQLARVQLEKGDTMSAWGLGPSETLPFSVTNTVLAPDSVTTDKILAGTILAGDIAAATITGTQIAANTITAGNLSVGTLSAITADLGTITAGTITGATFQTSASNPRVVLNSTGLNAFDSGGTNVFNLSSAGALTIASGTITGATIKTSSSSTPQVQIDGTVGLRLNANPSPSINLQWYDYTNARIIGGMTPSGSTSTLARMSAYALGSGAAGQSAQMDLISNWNGSAGASFGAQLSLISTQGATPETKVVATAVKTGVASPTATIIDSEGGSTFIIKTGATQTMQGQLLMNQHLSMLTTWNFFLAANSLINFQAAGPGNGNIDEAYGVRDGVGQATDHSSNFRAGIFGTNSGGTAAATGWYFWTGGGAGWSSIKGKRNIVDFKDRIAGQVPQLHGRAAAPNDHTILAKVRRLNAKHYDKSTKPPGHDLNHTKEQKKARLAEGDWKPQVGFIAEEIEKEFPDLVETWAPTKDRPEEMKWLDAGWGLHAVLLEAIKELADKVDALEARLPA